MNTAPTFGARNYTDIKVLLCCINSLKPALWNLSPSSGCDSNYTNTGDVLVTPLGSAILLFAVDHGCSPLQQCASRNVARLKNSSILQNTEIYLVLIGLL